MGKDFAQFDPAPEDTWYYEITAPSDTSSVVRDLVDPFWPPTDPTWGRGSIPRSPIEVDILRDGSIAVEYRKLVPDPKKPNFWLTYSIYYSRSLKDSGSLKADLIWVHGINDYGAKLVYHARPFLEAGYRLILPDLPGHGRSTGLHVYVSDLSVFADAVNRVLLDVRALDAANSRSPAKTFLSGFSLGGYIVADYCTRYHDPEIAGAQIACPMVAIKVRPNIVVEMVGRALSLFFGRLPYIHALRGTISDDPSVEAEFLADPMTYHGKIRIATALACLKGTLTLPKRTQKIKIPIQILHGTGDRVCDYSASKNFYEKLKVEDKEFVTYDGVS